MNRRELQLLARLRLQESRALFKAGLPAGAFYLAGYSIECALKACIAKKVRRHDFPDKATVEKSWKHDLKQLANAAELGPELERELVTSPQFSANWGVVKDWSERARYRTSTSSIEARDMIRAVSAPTHGVLRWLIRRW
jgi:hypothetical protein